MNRISSSKYLAGSRGAPCTLRIAGCCTGNAETTVPAHIKDRHAGRSIKASDLSVADACGACHAKFDGQAGEPLSREEWLFYALRGLQETLERRVEIGLLFVPLDAPAPFHERPVRPRKPPSERTKVPQSDRPIQQRSDAWPPKGSRKIQRKVTT